MNEQLAAFLRRIPQSNQDAQTLRTLSESNEQACIHYGMATMLQVWGIVTLETRQPLAESEIRATSQTAKYTLMSLAEYAATGNAIVPDWKTRGIKEDVLANGASLLHLLERARLDRTPNPAPARRERVAQVLIKRTNPQTQAPELLFQYDANAAQYQPIGGRWRENDGEGTLVTIIREIEEELPHNALQHGTDYQLVPVIRDFVPPLTLSQTFGALTEYHFDIYHMMGLQQPLQLGVDDRWLTVEAVLQNLEGVVNDNSIYHTLDARLGGLANLDDSL